MTRLKEKYIKEIIPVLKGKFGYTNNLAVPKLEKAVVHVGLNRSQNDEKFAEIVESTLLKITGQRPVRTKAKKSISNFKIRKGMIIGMMVTLRGDRMYDFVDKLINITLPRVRDFRGLPPRALDKNGNLSIGFKENICFPEIKSDEIERLHGLQVTIKANAKSREEGFELLKLLGFPFREK